MARRVTVVPTIELYNIAEKENIAIDYLELGNFYGLYVSTKGLKKACVVLNKSLLGNERLLRCVLAHELGHHFRTVGISVSATTIQPYYIPAKAEALADNWALDFLVPKNQLEDKLKQKYTIDDLAEFFYVEREFAWKQMERVEASCLV